MICYVTHGKTKTINLRPDHFAEYFAEDGMQVFATFYLTRTHGFISNTAAAAIVSLVNGV